MRALLVNPEFPDSYWSQRYSLRFTTSKVLLPPLSLITVAALLPERWECRLVDLAIEPLTDEALGWADVVMLTGMLVQQRSLQDILMPKATRLNGCFPGRPWRMSSPGTNSRCALSARLKSKALRS